MFTEVIKLTPQIDRAALAKMFRDLNQRFGQVAKKFGDGLKNAFKFGGVATLVAGFAAKLLNPLQKAEELINKITGKGDDAVTNAEEFESDAGKLLRLEAVAAAKGVDSATLRQFLGKFQTQLAAEKEAANIAARTGKPAPSGRLTQFLGETDVADAFFKFIQSMQGLDKETQTVIQNEIFGERIRGRGAELFNAKDFGEILSQLPSSEALGAAAKRSGSLGDLKDLLTAKRESEDFITKSGLLDESQIKAIDESERLKNRADDETLKRFDSLKTSSIAIQELTAKFDRFATDFLTNVGPELVKGVNTISKVAEEFLPSFREVKDTVTTGFDLGLEAMASVTVKLEEFWSVGSEYFDGAIQKVAGAVGAIESVWGEFKSSRIYRTFGGGN